MQKKLLSLFSKDKVIILSLFVIALLPRIYQLNRFPPGIIHDELNYVLNAKSLFHTGENIPLTASALFSWGEKNYDVVISELPSYLILLWVGLTKLSFFTARLPYAIVSSFSVVLLYLISKHLLGKEIAKWSGLVMALNPWSIHFGRMALEVNFATFFFLLGMYLFLILPSRKIFYALVFLIAMFLSYLGAKLHFLPLITILLIYKYHSTKDSKKQKKIYLKVLGLSLLILLAYVLTLDYQPSATRRVELILFERNWAASLVNQERLQAIPNAGLEILSNKATVIIRRIADIYLRGFSTIGLFTRGETVSVYSIWQYGQFHHVDFFLILLGLVITFSLSQQVFWLLITIILLAPTVSSIDLVERTFAIRAYPMFPMFSIIIGVGLWYLKEKIKFKRIIFGIVGLVYLVSLVYFFNIYFYRYPIYAAERWFLSERIIANYVIHAENNSNIKNIYVSTNESPKIVFEEYLFFSGLYENKENITKINENIENHKFSLGKVNYLDGCPENINLGEADVLISHKNFECSEEEPGKRGIVDLKDAGTVYYIDNDLVCNQNDLARYYRPMETSAFDLEKMTKDEFCTNWIISF